MSAEEHPVQITDDELTELRAWWDDLIRNTDGSLNEDNLYAELHDYKFLLEQAMRVYSDVTCGQMNKPSYFAEDVIATANECNDYWTAVIVREVLDRIDAGETTQELRQEYPDPDTKTA